MSIFFKLKMFFKAITGSWFAFTSRKTKIIKKKKKMPSSILDWFGWGSLEPELWIHWIESSFLIPLKYTIAFTTIFKVKYHFYHDFYHCINKIKNN